MSVPHCCFQCKRVLESPVLCSGCRHALYCNESCLKIHEPIHKYICEPWTGGVYVGAQELIHPNSTPEMTLTFGADLEFRAKVLVEQPHTNWQTNSLAEYASFIYAQAEFQKQHKYILPSSHLETVWQTHLLRSATYSKFCQTRFGQIVDHDILLSKPQFVYQKTPFLSMYPIYDWQKRVLFHTFKFLSLNGTPKDVFGCILNVWFSFNEISKFIVDWEKEKERIKRNQKGNFDVNKDFILEAQFQNDRCWQSAFDYSFSSIRIPEYLKLYEKFIYFSWKYPNEASGRGVRHNVDLIWHSHMMLPSIFKSDLKRILGRVLHHMPKKDRLIDWLELPPPDGECSSQRKQKMIELWKKEFGTVNCQDGEAYHVIKTQSDSSEEEMEEEWE